MSPLKSPSTRNISLGVAIGAVPGSIRGNIAMSGDAYTLIGALSDSPAVGVKSRAHMTLRTNGFVPTGRVVQQSSASAHSEGMARRAIHNHPAPTGKSADPGTARQTHRAVRLDVTH